MSISEIKTNIIKKLNSIEDEGMLSDVYKLLQMEPEIENIYEVTEEENEGLNIAFKDVEADEVYSSLAVNELLEKWLKK
jgi:hypothetical protein